LNARKKNQIKKIEKALMQFTLKTPSLPRKISSFKGNREKQEDIGRFLLIQVAKTRQILLETSKWKCKGPNPEYLMEASQGNGGFGVSGGSCLGNRWSSPIIWERQHLYTSAPFYLASPKNVRFSIFLALTNIWPVKSAPNVTNSWKKWNPKMNKEIQSSSTASFNAPIVISLGTGMQLEA